MISANLNERYQKKRNVSVSASNIPVKVQRMAVMIEVEVK